MMGDHEYYADRHAAADDDLIYGIDHAEELVNTFFGRVPRSQLLSNISVRRGGIQWPTEDERQKMKTNNELLSEAENLRLQAERLEQIAAQREKYGDDPFKNGAVLKVDMKYRDTHRTYAYGVVKTAGRFWLSGRLIPQTGVTAVPINAGWTWEQFVAWLAQGDATVWRARGLEQVL